MDWNELWDSVATPPDPTLSEDEEQARTEALLSKANAITVMFGGLSK